MTVSYTGDVANGSSFGCFWNILRRWKGSVYKLVWRELVAYLIVYFTINVIYRNFLDGYQRSVFEKLKVYCSKQIESIPMSFVLGFYVTLIVKRWWDQYWILPLPDSLALYVSASITGQDERARILRRTIMRYAMLSYIIMLQRISVRVKKRFPTLQHLVDTGLMMDSEMQIFDALEAKTTVSKFWLPTVWASNLVNRARLEGRIHSDHMVQTILMELSDFRRRLGRVGIYDTVSVPLVYTQVVTLAVYTYFMAALIGRQWVNPDNPGDRSSIYPAFELDLYFPIFLSLQFIFYIGWLKVAETLINPFGEDDDDYEMNWLIDRHIQVSYMVVDEIHEDHPELLKDQYWEQVVPTQLPYNLASNQYRRREPKGSTASMKIKEHESIYDNLLTSKRHSVIPDEVYADYESVTDSPLVDNRKNWIQRQLSRVESFRSTSSSSSLFNRNRSQLNQNGVLPNTHSGGHRLSLYDKLMNRRSSKDHSRRMSKSPPIATPRMNGGPPQMQQNLMPHPHTRPRVPTPEVSKETHVTFMTPVPSQKSLASKNYSGDGRINYHHPLTNSLSANSGSGYGYSTNNSNATTPPRNNVQQAPVLNQRPNSPISKSPPPSYDLSETPHLMLSPIEENDSSPYSTSSTNRSSKSSNYPTTSTIFGRKPSPPPPKDELPPIPVMVANRDENVGSIKPESEIIPPHTRKRIKSLSEEIDSEEPYMTIEEVGETKSGKKLTTNQSYRTSNGFVKQYPDDEPESTSTNGNNNDEELLIPKETSKRGSSDGKLLAETVNSKNNEDPTTYHKNQEHVNIAFVDHNDIIPSGPEAQESGINDSDNAEETPPNPIKDTEVFV